MQVSAPYDSAVRSVALDVLVPAADAFTCDDIALQAVAPAAIDVSRVQSATAAVGASAPLSGIPREDTKLLVATGLGGDDLPVVRGCASLGTVDHDVAIDIAAEPVTILSADAPPLGQPLPDGLRVTLTDLSGRTLAGAPIAWRVIGPAGVGDAGDELTNDSGVAMIPIDVSSAPGPVALVPVARWMVDPPDAVVGFTAPEPVVLDVPVAPAGLPRAPRHVVGRVGPDGQIGFALLSEPSAGGGGRSVLIAYRDGDAFTSVESTPVLGLTTLGINPLVGRDEVFGIVGDRWLEFRPDGTVGATTLTTTGVTAIEIGQAGQCPGAAGEGVALVRAADQWVAFDADRSEVSTPFAMPPPNAIGLIGTGCATTTTGGLRRAVVYGRDSQAPAVKADVDGVLTASWPTVAQSIGFSRALPGRAAPLLGVEVDTAGVAIVRYELLASGGALQLQQIDADDAITLPSGPAAGDVDGDGGLDVVAVLPIGESDDGVRVRIMVALDVDIDAEGTRLAGVSDEFLLTGNTRMSLVDIDGDGDDDIVLIGDERILVMPMGDAR